MTYKVNRHSRLSAGCNERHELCFTQGCHLFFLGLDGFVGLLFFGGNFHHPTSKNQMLQTAQGCLEKISSHLFKPKMHLFAALPQRA